MTDDSTQTGGTVNPSRSEDLPTVQETIDHVLWECFRHFVHLDEANAAIHFAPVRYSPLTFRLAEHLAPIPSEWLTPPDDYLLRNVLNHLGAYEEDRGR
jgi:hypothetical protein